MSGEQIDADYVDRILDVGVFYPTEEMAKNECENTSKDDDSV